MHNQGPEASGDVSIFPEIQPPPAFSLSLCFVFSEMKKLKEIVNLLGISVLKFQSPPPLYPGLYLEAVIYSVFVGCVY